MPAGTCCLFTMPDTLGIGVERRCPKPGITEWAVETAGFKLSHPGSSFSSSARGVEPGQAKSQGVLPAQPSPPSQTSLFLFC